MHKNLVRKYFEKDGAADEKRRLYLHLRKNPELLAATFSEEECLLLAQSVGDAGPLMSAQELMKQVALRKRRRRSRINQLIACAVLMVAAACYSLFYVRPQGNAPVANAVAPPAVLPSIINYTNNSVAVQTIRLSDGSIVHLEAGGTIRYRRYFEPARREVYLDGSATFKVAKNPARPFTVYCKEVATTALGTEFHVSSLPDQKISVKLIEGKIAVHNIKDGAAAAKKHYLLAGDAIVFDRSAATFSTMAEIEAAIARSRAKEREKMLRKQFDGENLPLVLDYIADAYRITIDYNPDSLAHIRFAGTLQRTEPAESLLQYIATMNNFTLSKDSTAKGVVFTIK